VITNERRAFESELLGKVFAGDDRAFNELYALYNPKLTVFAFKMLGQREMAIDLAQDIWSRLIEQRKSPQPVEYVGGYLYRIARNLCFDRLRSRRDHTPLDQLPEEQHPASVPTEPSDIEDIVIRSLDRLSAEDKELLVMHSYLGYGYDEIAEMQSKSPEAVWTRASRARAKLREIVRKAAEAEGVPIPGARI
jgi:RNA polymerase sigma-70 factor (ECF subfamily)